jgi:hypothetical protein
MCQCGPYSLPQLLCGAFITVLLPFTLAGGAESIWKTARVIAPLVVGLVVLFPAFILWEMKFARHPAIPFRVLKDRQIIAGITIACLLNTAWYCQGDYLFYTLQVSFDQCVSGWYFPGRLLMTPGITDEPPGSRTSTPSSPSSSVFPLVSL